MWRVLLMRLVGDHGAAGVAVRILSCAEREEPATQQFLGSQVDSPNRYFCPLFLREIPTIATAHG